MYKRNSNNSSTSRHTHLLEQAWGSGGGGRAGEEGGLRPGVEAHGLGSGVVMVILLSRLWPAPFVGCWGVIDEVEDVMVRRVGWRKKRSRPCR